MGSWSKDAKLRYCSPTPKILLFGVGFSLFAGLAKVVERLIIRLFQELGINSAIDFNIFVFVLLALSLLMILLAVIESVFRSDKRIIMYKVRKRLCSSHFGNPLHLLDGEIEPYIKVRRMDKGYKISVECQSAKYEDVTNLETAISGCLRGKFGSYAVVSKEEDIAGRFVDYYIEDVVAGFNQQSVYHSVDDVPSHVTRIFIRDDVYIDLSMVLNSSAIVAGRSRSGKTTAIISAFLLPIACADGFCPTIADK